MEPPQQVLLAYGWDRLLRDILAAALSSYDWQVLGSLTKISGEVRLALVNCSRLTAAEAIEDVQRAGAEYPSAKIVLLGSEITDPELLLLIEAGMSAYVDTREGLPELLDAFKMVRENRSPSSGRITQLVLESIGKRTRQRGIYIHPGLTFREREVLCLITRGLSNKEIADSLAIAPNTVKNHVHNLLEKLNVSSRHEAAEVEIRSLRQAGRSQVVRNAARL
jgi:two-component system nitrate/nitrite response regulator NarL